MEPGPTTAAGDDVAQRRVEDLQLGGGVRRQRVEQPVGQREAVGPLAVGDGGEEAGDHLVVMGDEFGEVGRHGAPFPKVRRGAARWPTG